jgi:hypothetical protein
MTVASVYPRAESSCSRLGDLWARLRPSGMAYSGSWTSGWQFSCGFRFRALVSFKSIG